MRLERRVIETPIGEILLAGTPRGLSFARVIESDREARDWARARGIEMVPDEGSLETAARAYAGYFAGRLRAFDVTLDLAGGTRFQRAVWEALRKLPYGTTTTYGALARALGLPITASRAVGSANGANPVVIAIPCHRVVRETGGRPRTGGRWRKRVLGGFAAGLWRKEYLLRMEGVAAFQPGLL